MERDKVKIENAGKLLALQINTGRKNIEQFKEIFNDITSTDVFNNII